MKNQILNPVTNIAEIGVALKYNLKPWTESTDIYYKRNLYFLFRYKNKTFLSKFGFLVKPIIKQLVFLKLN